MNFVQLMKDRVRAVKVRPLLAIKYINAYKTLVKGFGDVSHDIRNENEV